MLPFRNVTGDDDDYNRMMAMTMILNLYTILKPSTPIKFAYFDKLSETKLTRYFLVTLFAASSLVPKLSIDGGDDDHNNERRFSGETTSLAARSE